MYLLGYDIGSSAIKVSLVEAGSRRVIGLEQSPGEEMDLISRQRGWAEQQPEGWWLHCCRATRSLLEKTGIDTKLIKGIGIAYQMHGLVLVDAEQQVLRPSIIWCDSRAVPIGEQAFQEMGPEYCQEQLLNSPGNFTASRLKWVKDNEPEVYEKAANVLLPGDYIAMRFTGEVNTTISGLSEGIFWNFQKRDLDQKILQQFGLREDLLAPRVSTFSIQGKVHARAAEESGLAVGTPITYRAGDQPNNALALNVLHPGEIAATSGTSGVVYGIVDHPVYDPKSRINAFAHVNYEQAFNRIGVLLCLNGAGIQYSWLKHQVARSSHSYADMERMATSVPVGADGLCILPFGNGAERMLENRELNAHIFNLQFNRHTRAHLYRAALEGVAYSFVHGINLLKELKLNVDVIRVGNDNMFQSKVFSTTIATLIGSRIEMLDTNGATGAARAAGISAEVYSSLEEALAEPKIVSIFEPATDSSSYQQAYSYWQSHLGKALRKTNDPISARDEWAAALRLLQQKERQQLRTIANLRLQVKESKQLLAEISQLVKDTPNGESQPGLLKKVKSLDRQFGAILEEESLEETYRVLHHDFLDRLNKSHPSLSQRDQLLCILLKEKFSTKEIARQLNLSTRGVETGRYRLRKKLAVKGKQKLKVYLSRL
ncbi:MAG: FGGY family carbohydrate kinase [Lewinella sp.]|uniref:FGGY family carbohydrate kinase n=1 Tax=Lewinella sp. TaxID=2004506 RepID=UPI003D6BDBFD